mgnify:CR=1 FL=1
MPSTPDISSDDLDIDNRTRLDEIACSTREEFLKYGFGGKPTCDNNYLSPEEEHIKLINNLANAFEQLASKWENMNIWEILMNEVTGGSFKQSDFDHLFTEKELKMDQNKLRMTLTRDLVTENWELLDVEDQQKYYLMFKESNMPLDISLKPEVELDLAKLTRKKEVICSKFRIENDEYFYDFLPSNLDTFDYYEDRCLSIGSWSFFPVKQLKEFPYLRYHNYVIKRVIDPKKLGIIFAPSKSKYKFGDQTMTTIDSTWKHSFTTLDETSNPFTAYKTLFNHSIVTPPELLKLRYEQAARINNMKSGDYCALSFPQMQELSGFLMRMRNFKRPILPKSFLNYVSTTIKECFYNVNGCDRKLTIIIDCLHQVVIIKAMGEHVKECYEKNRESGYRVYRNIAINCNKLGVNLEESIKSNYPGQLEVIEKIGICPTKKYFRSWIAIKHFL